MEDSEIVKGILAKNTIVTKKYFYEKYYPLFKSVYNDYYTDACSCIEFINDIYIYILTPNKKTNKSPLETFEGRCTFGLWLKIVCINYCNMLFRRKKEKITFVEDFGDRNWGEVQLLDMSNINKADVEYLLGKVANERYRNLLRYHYIEGYTHEETAKKLGMNMDVYYNKHLLAKMKLKNAIEKEEGRI